MTPRQADASMLAWARTCEANCLREGNIPGAMRYARLAAVAEDRLKDHPNG